jgi:hypothetical protein
MRFLWCASDDGPGGGRTGWRSGHRRRTDGRGDAIVGAWRLRLRARCRERSAVACGGGLIRWGGPAVYCPSHRPSGPFGGGAPIWDVGPRHPREASVCSRVGVAGHGWEWRGGHGGRIGAAPRAGRRGWGWSSVRVGAFSTGCCDRSAAKARPSTTRRDQGRAHALHMGNPLEGRRLPRRLSERHRPAARLMRFLCCGPSRIVEWRGGRVRHRRIDGVGPWASKRPRAIRSGPPLTSRP